MCIICFVIDDSQITQYPLKAAISTRNVFDMANHAQAILAAIGTKGLHIYVKESIQVSEVAI